MFREGFAPESRHRLSFHMVSERV
ncbi:unnamed protein product [Victoria cruziana]